MVAKSVDDFVNIIVKVLEQQSVWSPVIEPLHIELVQSNLEPERLDRSHTRSAPVSLANSEGFLYHARVLVHLDGLVRSGSLYEEGLS